MKGGEVVTLNAEGVVISNYIFNTGCALHLLKT
jgi:hypothetical protein